MKRIVYFTAALLLFSCNKENRTPRDPVLSGEPIITFEATDISQHSAILWGYVNPSQIVPGVEIGIAVSMSDNFSIEEGIKLISLEIDKSNKFFVEATGLAAGTQFFYRAFLDIGDTCHVGEMKSFTTEAFQFTAVDLGLSVKWANANLGASAPEKYGDYYAWGDTEKKWRWDWNTYKWSAGSPGTFTKYNYDSSYGIVDNKITLDEEDDVAHVKLGNKWRLPTDEEMKELKTFCTWKWTTINGIEGERVTGKNGNSIFFPAAGYYYSAACFLEKSFGFYWTSSLNPDYPDRASFLSFGTNALVWDTENRCYGFSVRPVSE